MTIGLTDNDISVLKALLRDGRKSFRQISSEIGISTPAVKARFMRLLNMGVIKSVSPILDLDKLTYQAMKRKVQNNAGLDAIIEHARQLDKKNRSSDIQIDKQVKVKLNCDYCKIPLFTKMFTLKFGNLERFFCCKECRSAYKKKYAGKIKAITRRYHKSNGKTGTS